MQVIITTNNSDEKKLFEDVTKIEQAAGLNVDIIMDDGTKETIRLDGNHDMIVR